MIKVKYEKYWNDYRRENKEETFPDLNALADWIFGQMQQDYTKAPGVMSFPTTKKVEQIGADGPYHIEFKPQWGGETIWIHLIKSSGGIIFSDGRFTSGLKHWSSEVKTWLTACEQRRRSPKFNFVDEKPAEPAWFAMTRWSVDDVIAAAEEQGVDMSAEQAAAWWKENESRFKDMLTECGNNILAGMDFGGEG